MSSLLFDVGNDGRCGSCTPPPSSQQSHPCYQGGSHSGAVTLGSARVPPFVPRPHRGGVGTEALLPLAGGGSGGGDGSHHQQRRTQSAASGTASAVSSTVTCNAHEVCHYFQQVFYVSAILTGIALVIAGAIQTGAPDDLESSAAAAASVDVAGASANVSDAGRGGDLLVFVYIGVLLIGVNVSLLLLQCYVRSKELRRARRSAAAQNATVVVAPPAGAAVHYNPLVSGAPPRQVALPCTVGGPSALLAQQPAVLPSPSGKGQPRRGYPPTSVHSAATAPTFPTAQPHCWLLPPASRAATTVASQPPPSYDNLMVANHAPRDVATLHLI